MKLDIEVRIIKKARLKEQDWQDFVIYDDKYVRWAKPTTDTGSNTLKHATVTMKENEVKQFMERFENLLAKSMDATEFYSRRLEQGTVAALPPSAEE